MKNQVWHNQAGDYLENASGVSDSLALEIHVHLAVKVSVLNRKDIPTSNPWFYEQ